MTSSSFGVRRRLAAALALSALVAAPAALAQAYPSKLVTGVVAFPAGAQADVTARMVTSEMQKRLGQSLIIDNVAGVGGALGAQKVLSAPADGHTLLFATVIESTQTPLAMASVKYKSEDFRMVGPVASTYMMVVVRPSLQVQSLADLVAMAKKSGDKPMTYGSVGRGSIYHLVAERFAADTGVKLLHVPYKGAAQLLPDIVGGQIDLVFLPLGGPVAGMLQKGQLKPLAFTGPKRHPAFPNVPTIEETKLLKDFQFNAWVGLLVPKATPDAVVTKLNAILGETLREPKVRADIEATGGMAADPMPLDAAARFYSDEIARYRAIAKQIGLQPE